MFIRFVSIPTLSSNFTIIFVFVETPVAFVIGKVNRTDGPFESTFVVKLKFVFIEFDIGDVSVAITTTVIFEL